jgi:hypothetical protein
MENLKIQSRDAHGKGGMRTEGTGFALALDGEEIILPSHPRGGPPGPSSLPSLSDEMGKFGSHSSHDDEDVVGTSGKVWGHECPVGPFCQRSQLRGTKIPTIRAPTLGSIFAHTEARSPFSKFPAWVPQNSRNLYPFAVASQAVRSKLHELKLHECHISQSRSLSHSMGRGGIFLSSAAMRRAGRRCNAERCNAASKQIAMQRTFPIQGGSYHTTWQSRTYPPSQIITSSCLTEGYIS